MGNILSCFKSDTPLNEGTHSTDRPRQHAVWRLRQRIQQLSRPRVVLPPDPQPGRGIEIRLEVLEQQEPQSFGGGNGDENSESIGAPVAGKSKNITITDEEVTKSPAEENEIKFYINEKNKLRHIIPEVIEASIPERKLVLSNLGKGMKSPRHIDIKIGGSFYDEWYLLNIKQVPRDKLKEKQDKRINKNIQNRAETNGYWIAGYTNQPSFQSKEQKLQYIREQGAQKILSEFFQNNPSIALKVAEQIRTIQDTLKTPDFESYAFIASSLLIFYDGSPPNDVVVGLADFDQFIKYQQGEPKEKANAIREFNTVFYRGLKNIEENILEIYSRQDAPQDV